MHHSVLYPTRTLFSVLFIDSLRIVPCGRTLAIPSDLSSSTTLASCPPPTSNVPLPTVSSQHLTSSTILTSCPPPTSNVPLPTASSQHRLHPAIPRGTPRNGAGHRFAFTWELGLVRRQPLASRHIESSSNGGAGGVDKTRSPVPGFQTTHVHCPRCLRPRLTSISRRTRSCRF